MGKVLDTLKQGEGARGTAAGRLSPAAGTAEDCVVEWTLGEGEVPFIEVGGPNKKVETSPGLVVKHPPQPKVQPPHAPVEKVAAAPAVNLTAARPLAVAYEPWTGADITPAIAPEVVAFHQPEHAVSREYAALAGVLLAGTPPQVILLAGLRPRVGTTTVLLNLGVTAARDAARRVVLIDGNLSHPGLAAGLGHGTPAGIQEVLAGNVALEQAVLATAMPSLRLLAAGRAGKPSPVSAEAMAWLLGWLRERFDLVLIDGPPLEETTALATLAPLCDGMYVVLAQGESSQASRGLAQSLPRLGGRLRGLIHTRFAA